MKKLPAAEVKHWCDFFGAIGLPVLYPLVAREHALLNNK